MEMIEKYHYAVLLAVFIVSTTVAYSGSKVAAVTDVYFDNNSEQINTFDSVYIQNKNRPKFRGEMRLTMTDTEQLRIAEIADSVHFWNLPKNPSGNTDIIPNPGKQMLRIRTEKADRTITWEGRIMDGKIAGPLLKITTLLDSIVGSKPDYKKLPTPTDNTLDRFMPPPGVPPTY